MKKKLLFVIPSLDAGGAEKSLVNWLSIIDYEHYEVDVFLFRKEGLFLSLLPPQVKVLSHGTKFRQFSKPLLMSLLALVGTGRWKLALARLAFAAKNKTEHNKARAEQYSWKHYREALPSLDKAYDCAVGFLEKSSIYFVVDNVLAKRKIGWIHTDYSQSLQDPDFDRSYFEKLHYIVTISEACAEQLVANFPLQSEKIHVVENISSPTLIKKLSEEPVAEIEGRRHLPLIVTVGRLSREKGMDLAVEAAHALRDKGIPFLWMVIGDGAERQALQQQILDLGLEDHFLLLGLKANPYPYMAAATLYVQPSRHEGKSIAIDEAMILNKPIVLTNFSTAKDQIDNGRNGSIVPMNAPALADEIARLLSDAQQRAEYAAQLKALTLDPEEEMKKFNTLVDGK